MGTYFLGSVRDRALGLGLRSGSSFAKFGFDKFGREPVGLLNFEIRPSVMAKI